MTLQLDVNDGRRVAEIIEVVIHSILYLRQIYPPEAFVRRKKFEVPVFQCASDTVNDYISGIIKEFANELVQTEKMILMLLDGEVMLERYSFTIGTCQSDIEAEWQCPENMRRILRAVLVKLNAIDSILSPVTPSDTRTFSVVLETKTNDKFKVEAQSRKPNKPTSNQWIHLSSQKAARLEESQAAFNVNTVNIGHVQLNLQIAEFHT